MSQNVTRRPQHQRTYSHDPITRLTKKNNELLSKINDSKGRNDGGEKAKTKIDDSIFKKISQKTMDRTNKVALMYATPKEDKYSRAHSRGLSAG